MKLLLFILLNSALLLNAACATNCTFDDNYFTESTYSKQSFKSSSWLEESKELKAITQSNDLLSVKHWSCNHLGLTATLLSTSVKPSSELVASKVLELGEFVLETNDITALEQIIRSSKLVLSEQRHELQIPNTQHQQFKVSYQFINQNLFIELTVLDN